MTFVCSVLSSCSSFSTCVWRFVCFGLSGLVDNLFGGGVVECFLLVLSLFMMMES